ASCCPSSLHGGPACECDGSRSEDGPRRFRGSASEARKHLCAGFRRAACSGFARRGGTHVAWSRRTSPGAARWHHASSRGSPVSAEQVLEHHLVERKVRDELLEFSVFLLELPHLADVTDAELAELSLPDVERPRAHPELAPDLRRRRTCLQLTQCGRNLY